MPSTPPQIEIHNIEIHSLCPSFFNCEKFLNNKGKKNNPPMRCSSATMTKDEIEYNSCLKNPSMLQSNAAKITASGGMIFFNMA